MKPCWLTVLLKTQYYGFSIEDAVLSRLSIEDSILRRQYRGGSIEEAVLRTQN